MADAKKQSGVEYFKYNGIFVLEAFSIDKFLKLIREDLIKVDFDARSGYERKGHNHGTKFRMNSDLFLSLYADLNIVLDQPLNYSERLKYIDLTTIRLTKQIEEVASEGPVVIQIPLIEN